jgi:large subunit ribosomal protein L15
MRLNTLSPAPGSKKTRLRVGRGASAGQGKTCGRGVKGQRARKGGYHRSKVSPTVGEVMLSELAKVEGTVIDLETLKKAGVVDAQALRARIVSSGGIARAVTVKGIHVTKGALAAIVAAGGQVEPLEAPAPATKLAPKPKADKKAGRKA